MTYLKLIYISIGFGVASAAASPVLSANSAPAASKTAAPVATKSVIKTEAKATVLTSLSTTKKRQKKRKKKPSINLAKYPWLGPKPTDYTRQTLRDSYPAPIGYRRIRYDKQGFGTWLRGLAVKDGPVVLHDGTKKWQQEWHENIVDIDVGRRDLQQCADFAIRLRAEYLYSRGEQCERYIRFILRNGKPAVWKSWQKGYRPVLRKGSIAWSKKALPSSGYEPFRNYLDATFSWADSTAVKRQTVPVVNPMKLRAGDIFVMSNADAGQGADFGHVVMVMDVVKSPLGHRKFLLGQGFQPAQSFHILKNPNSDSAWYSAKFQGDIETPEWVFHTKHLRRFRRSRSCD